MTQRQPRLRRRLDPRSDPLPGPASSAAFGKLRPAAGLASFLALARVCTGAHYPGDVAGGMLVGIIVALGGWPLAVRLLEPLAARLARSPLRPLVPARDGQ